MDGLGEDSTGLGRWGWIWYQGKSGKKLRIITVYRPCKAIGSKTAYTQQLRYLVKKGDERNPRDVLTENLGLEIENGSGEERVL